MPKKLKDIAFRKPFSKKLKDHILDTIYEELPPQKITRPKSPTAELDLNTLFSTDEEGEFFGFENTVANSQNTSQGHELRTIFETDDTDDEFYGFFPNHTSLELVFFSDSSENEEFLGF